MEFNYNGRLLTMQRKLAKNRKYVVADMHERRRHVIAPSCITLSQCVAKMTESSIVDKQPKTSDICSDKSLLLSLSKIRSTLHAEDSEETEDQKKYITRTVAKYKMPTTQRKTGAFEEFVNLTKETRDYLEYYLKKFDKQYSQLLTPALKDGKSIILCLLKNHFDFFKTNSPQLNDRLLLSLDINPLNDFSSIDWAKYSAIRKFVTQKDFDTLGAVKFLLKFFFQSHQKTISRYSLKQIFRILVEKLDSKLMIAKQKTITEKVMNKAQRKGLFGTSGLVSQNTLRQAILHEQLFCNQDIVSIIFSDF